MYDAFDCLFLNLDPGSTNWYKSIHSLAVRGLSTWGQTVHLRNDCIYYPEASKLSSRRLSNRTLRARGPPVRGPAATDPDAGRRGAGGRRAACRLRP